MRRVVIFLIRIGISAGILCFLFGQVEIGKITEVISHSAKSMLLFALALFVLISFILFLRWRMLLMGLGLNLPRSLIFKSFCLGFFSNLFFPSTVGGDFVKSAELGLRTGNPRRVAASVILDRISGYSALVTVLLLALLLGHRIVADAAVFYVIGIISILLIAMLSVLFNNFLFLRLNKLLHLLGRIGEALCSLHQELYNFKKQRRIIVKNFTYSLIIQLIMSFATYLISYALGVKVGLLYFFILVPIINTVSALPISVAGLGLREASSMYFFSRVGIPKETALAIALLVFSMIFLLSITGGIIYILTFSYKRLRGRSVI